MSLIKENSEKIIIIKGIMKLNIKNIKSEFILNGLLI